MCNRKLHQMRARRTQLGRLETNEYWTAGRFLLVEKRAGGLSTQGVAAQESGAAQ